MRVLPRSLFGRLVLVLLAGLLAAQLLSTAILFQDRGRSVYQASGLQSAQRLADIVRLLLVVFLPGLALWLPRFFS